MLSAELTSIGLVNPKSAENVAAVMRAAGCYGVSSVLYTGKRFDYAKKHAPAFRQDTKAARLSIPLLGVNELIESMPKGAIPVAVELVEDATPLPAFEHPKNAFYIFGPEDGSLTKSIVSACQHTVYIPTQNSMNLAVSVNVVLYDRLAKSDYPHSNQFIRGIRDVNNNL